MKLLLIFYSILVLARMDFVKLRPLPPVIKRSGKRQIIPLPKIRRSRILKAYDLIPEQQEEGPILEEIEDSGLKSFIEPNTGRDNKTNERWEVRRYEEFTKIIKSGQKLIQLSLELNKYVSCPSAKAFIGETENLELDTTQLNYFDRLFGISESKYFSLKIDYIDEYHKFEELIEYYNIMRKWIHINDENYSSQLSKIDVIESLDMFQSSDTTGLMLEHK